MNFVLYVLKTGYREFEDRVGNVASPKGSKTELVEAAIEARHDEFTLAGLERACPVVSRDLIRKVLRRLRQSGRLESLGRGSGAMWRKKG